MTNIKVKPIRTEEDLESALARIYELMDATPGTDESEELDVLTDLVEHYESKHVPMGWPGPVAAIEFHMEQNNLSPRDLIPFIGSRAKVSEVLSGKRAITMPMARALHEHLGIPAEVLLHPPETMYETPLAELEWHRFPLKAMVKMDWIPGADDLLKRTKEVMLDLINRAGGEEIASAVYYRKNDHARANAKMDPYALKAWCWHVLAQANENPPKSEYKPETVTLDFLKAVGKLSRNEFGPLQAKQFLAENGISLVIAQHLPKTYLDGAALQLGGGQPVVGLTLRYDRIDNFWFCLLHELAHVGLHLNADDSQVFVDDMSLRNAIGEHEDVRENEADDLAEEALIPTDVWKSWIANNPPTGIAVLNLANALEIHPAIVAGRVRYERQNYRLLSHFVGTSQIRGLFQTG